MSKSEDTIIDPSLQEELEQMPGENPALIEYGLNNSQESDSISFTSEWFPGQNEWQGKTNITVEQAYALSVVRSLQEYYEELEDIATFFTSLIENYEMYLTSVDGNAREQQAQILCAVHGDASEMHNPENSWLGKMFSNPPDNDD